MPSPEAKTLTGTPVARETSVPAGVQGWATARIPTAVAVAAFAVLAIVSGLHVQRMLAIPGVFDDNRCGLVDFRDQAYYPAVAVLQGDNPYAAGSYMRRYPAVKVLAPYSPVMLAMFLPFGLLPLWAAQLLYYLVSVGLILLLAGATLDACGRKLAVREVFVLATAILASRPGEWNTLLGQFGVLGALATSVALYNGQARPRLAGVALAVSCFKPTYGLPLVLLMLAQRARRAVGIGIAIAAAFSAAVLLVLIHSAGGIGPFVQGLHEGFAAWRLESADPLATVHRVDAAALLAKALARWPGVAVDLGIGAIVIGVGCAVMRRLASGEPHGGATGLAASVGCLIVLTGIYHLTYDQVLLVLPIVWLATRPARRSVDWVVLTLLLLPMVNYLASEKAAALLGLSAGGWYAVTILSATTPFVALCIWAVAARPGLRGEA